MGQNYIGMFSWWGQLAHPCKQSTVFVVRLKRLWVLGYPQSVLLRFWSGCLETENPIVFLYALVFSKSNVYRTLVFTSLCLASHKRELVNCVDPDQTPQNAASDQGLHCIKYRIFIKHTNNKITIYPFYLKWTSPKSWGRRVHSA